MTIEARIRQAGTHRFWTCPGCSRTLGEIIGVRLVIIVQRERILNFPITDDLHMTCPKCGQVSVYREPASRRTELAS